MRVDNQKTALISLELYRLLVFFSPPEPRIIKMSSDSHICPEHMERQGGVWLNGQSTEEAKMKVGSHMAPERERDTVGGRS